MKNVFFLLLAMISLLDIARAQPQGVSTLAAVGASATTASSGGNIYSNGGFAITARGVCWSTALNPTVALTTKTTDGTGAGSFTSTITGLTLGTTYHVRAYATYVGGTIYGANLSFVINLPALTATPISSILASTAVSGGNVSADGGSAVTSRGVCWSTALNPTVALTTKTRDSIGMGSFTSNITGLTGETTYHARAYATNASGTVYGPDLVFIATNKPSLTTTGITITSGTTAKSGGTFISGGNSAVTARGICWSTALNPTVALATKTTDSTGTGIYTSNITGLTLGTIYHVRAYATNSAGTAYGNDVVFTATGLAVGLSAMGGKIAYLDGTGWHGLIVAPSDQGSFTWNNARTVCDTLNLNNYSDWRLPSKADLNNIYLNRVAIGGLSNTYWSSEHWPAGQEDFAYFMYFSNGTFGSQNCTITTIPVRAVRAF